MGLEQYSKKRQLRSPLSCEWQLFFYPPLGLYLFFLFLGGGWDWTTVFFVFKRSHIWGMRVGRRGQHRDRNSFIHILGTQDLDRKRRRSSDLLFLLLPFAFSLLYPPFSQKRIVSALTPEICVVVFRDFFSGPHNMRASLRKQRSV